MNGTAADAVAMPSSNEEPALPAASSSVLAGDAELLEQQLRLIQLCFGEHEFGIAFNASGDMGMDDAESSSTSGTEGSEGEEASSSGVKGDSLYLPGDDRDFSPQQFIEGKLSNGVPLGVLCRDLSSFVSFIQEKIGQHVNADVHASFLDVSSHLVGMQEELQSVAHPLNAAIKKMSTAKQQLVEASNVVQTKLDHACSCELERVFDTGHLKCLLVYEKATVLIDALLPAVERECAPMPTVVERPSDSTTTIVPGADRANNSGEGNSLLKIPSPASTDFSLSKGTLGQLEEAAALAQRLKGQVMLLPTLPQREEERVEAMECAQTVTSAVLEALQRVFAVMCSRLLNYQWSQPLPQDQQQSAVFFNSLPLPYTAEQESAVARLVRIYAQTGETQEFCVMMRDAVLRPFLDSILSWKAATQARQNVEEAVRLLGVLHAELQSRVVPFLLLLRRCYAPSNELYPSSDILWPAVCEALVKKLVSLYEVGIPEAFQRKYVAAYKLLALAQSICASVSELERLRQSPEVALWIHKWNTEVYVALRCSEASDAIAKSLEVFSASSTAPSPFVSLSACQLEPIAVLEAQMQRFFEPGIFLYVCTSKFLHQCATLTHSTLKSLLTQCSGGDNPGGNSCANPQSESLGSSSSSTFNLLLQLISDLQKLKEFVKGPLRCAVRDALGSSSALLLSHSQGTANSQQKLQSSAGVASDVEADPLDALFALITDGICELYVGRAQRLMVSRVVEECAAALQNLKTIRSVYHTKKALPTTASLYVSNFLQPFERFAIELRRSGGCPEALATSLVSGVAAQLAEQFTALARETLLTAKKTEESWEKLRKRKETGTDGAGSAASPVMASPAGRAGSPRESPENITSRDKMVLQMHKDACAMVNAMVECGVPRDLPSFIPLFALLRRAEWIEGADIPEPPDIDENE